MPNWCTTTYVVVGCKQDVKDLYFNMQRLESRDKSLIDNGFGKTWLGNLVHLLGGDWQKIRCRGEWSELDFEGETLTFNTWSAWCELDETRHFVEQHYGNRVKFYYMSEEPMMQYFVTNDAKGEYFPARFVVEMDDCERQDFTTKEAAKTYIETIIGRKLQDTENPETALHNWAEQTNGKDFYCIYYEFAIVTD